MKVLIIHNQLWAHYKSYLFSEVWKALKKDQPTAEMLVAQIGLYEASRAVMRPENGKEYEYPYKVLFERSLSEIAFIEKTKALFNVYFSTKPDVLNITGYYDLSQILLAVVAKLSGVKVVMSVESSVADHARAGWRETFKKWILKIPNAFFCFGDSTKAYLQMLGVRKEKIPVDNAAVVDEEFILSTFEKGRLLRAKGAPLTFVFVGRLAPEKNLELLMQAFKELNEKFPNKIQLRLVGDGPERSSLEKFAREEKLSNVVFEGGMAWNKVPGLLAQSDVLILPSLSEPWGLVVNEAMVCSMPVIVSASAGSAELVKSGVNGFVFNPRKKEELLGAMAYFAENSEKIPTMGMASASRITHFSSKQVATKMANCFATLVARKSNTALAEKQGAA